MEKLGKTFESLNLQDIEAAAFRAFRGHSGKREVIKFKNDFESECNALYSALKDGSWRQKLSYRKLVKVNNNGKVRNIESPSLYTRIYQHLFLNIIEETYFSKDNRLGVNCKQGYGITATDKSKSAVKRLKHIFYDCRFLNYYLVIDQRKCYEHISTKVFRKMLKRMISDTELVDFATDVCFAGKTLPIGTPTSPLAHHIIMLWFDYIIKGMTRYSVRYADNCFLSFSTKEEAHQAMWRIQNYWWYELGLRAKRHSIIIAPMTKPCDFCGFVFHRNPGRKVTDHDKGYVTIRKSIIRRAAKCRKDVSWASYFGIMQHSDSYRIMINTERNMNLSSLTQKIRINRNLDAKNIEIKELLNRKITIYDYELRYNSQREANWIKCLIGFEETENGEPTGRIAAREFHGNYQGIIQFIQMCEREYGKKDILPIEEVEIENQCGYIFKGSTNQLNYIIQ